MINLNWTQYPKDLIGLRVMFIGDGTEGYYAELPPNITEDEAIEAFIETYDFAPDGREVWEATLRADITSALYERFNGDSGELEESE
jgi:hypothetical protein